LLSFQSEAASGSAVFFVYRCDGAEGRDVTESRQQDLAVRFEQSRRRLWAVAFRMLGASGEADEAVQEAWLRLARATRRRSRTCRAG